MNKDRLERINNRCLAFTPDRWELTEEPPRECKESENSVLYGYFKHVDNEKVFCTAYDICGLDTLGDYECGAMEKPAAEFVFHAKVDVPWLVSEVQRLTQVLESIQANAHLAAEMCDSEGRAAGFRLIENIATAAIVYVSPDEI